VPRTPRHRTGTIRAYRRADGGTSWKAVVKYPDPDDPQRWQQRARTFPTRAEAKAWLDAALAEHRAAPTSAEAVAAQRGLAG
jgi:hypothetical protein